MVVYMMHTLSVEASSVFNLDVTSCKILPFSEQTWAKGPTVGLSKLVTSNLTATVTPYCQLGQEYGLDGTDHIQGLDLKKNRAWTGRCEHTPRNHSLLSLTQLHPKKPFIVIIDAAPCHVSAEYRAEMKKEMQW
eukprot:4824544-Amphidinium_carterae.1